jgi:regulator of sirC expression with transglutaminase-like and TPR domain
VSSAFTATSSDYDDPRNSCLHTVLRRRVGLPITLSVLLIELGRRVGLPIVGVGLPAHFLAAATDLPGVYIDMFHGGRLLSEFECRTLLRTKTQGAGRIRARNATPDLDRGRSSCACCRTSSSCTPAAASSTGPSRPATASCC